MSTRSSFQDDRFLRPIRQLDRVLINKIAAGEVIERPASVVKELVENSFDAGATAVDVVAKKAGTTFISVTDNGSGIPAVQVKLAFSRHATSKIEKVDDLFAVTSFGFRGEALPSIASISHLTMTTRHFSEEAGSRLIIEGGREIETRAVSAPVGTTVEVSHLFFNTPARRKFLKSETTESRQIVRVTERMALGRPSVAVSLNLNEREVFRLHEGQPIADRMAVLFGVDRDAIVEYDVELGGVSYLVYLAHPDQARNDRTRICLFINGRSVTSSSIIHAVTAGYGEYLPGGRFPLAAIFISVDPDRLDVNVHPTKAEVRMSEEQGVHDNLYRIVQRALRDWRLIAGARRPEPQAQIPQAGAPFAGVPRPTPGFRSEPGLFTKRTGERPPENRGFIPSDAVNIYESTTCDNTRPVSETGDHDRQTPPVIEEDDITYLGKTGRQYLLFLIRGELCVVDQHAAHERVLYEGALKQVEKGSAASQKLLFPETLDLSAEEYLTFESSQQVLVRLGFEIEAFGLKAVIINGMPLVFGGKNPSLIIHRLLDDIMVLDKAGGELIKSVAQSVACRAAVMAGDRLSSEEARTLVHDLLATSNPYCCPHGRPTFVKISLEELDGRFGRG